MPATGGTRLRFDALGCVVQITTHEASAARWLQANFAAFPAASPGSIPDLAYEVLALPGPPAGPHTEPRLQLLAPGQAARCCTGGSELLFELEQHLVVALQQARPELLFLHAAALVYRERACLLVGESGAGKSTTAWALLERGWGCLSDELAPLELPSGQVLAYPHAICLKRPPPDGVAWPPRGLLDLGTTLHLPLPAGPAAPCPLGAIVFVHHTPPPETAVPSIRRVSAAEAAARLYVQTLNPLAHPERGLDVVRRTAQRVPCFQLQAAGLRASAALLEQTLADALPGSTARG